MFEALQSLVYKEQINFSQDSTLRSVVGMSSPNVAICSVILILVHCAFGNSLEPHLVARKR